MQLGMMRWYAAYLAEASCGFHSCSPILTSSPSEARARDVVWLLMTHSDQGRTLATELMLRLHNKRASEAWGRGQLGNPSAFVFHAAMSAFKRLSPLGDH